MHRFLIRSSSSTRGITAASSSAIFSSSVSTSSFSSSSELKPPKWALTSDSCDNNNPSLSSCESTLPIELSRSDGSDETFSEPPNKKLKQQSDFVSKGKDDGPETKTKGVGKGKDFNEILSGNNNSNSMVSTNNVGGKGNNTNVVDDPMSLMTWNMNGLLVRLKNPEQWQKFISFVECHRPDVIGLQEVRLPVHPSPPPSSSFFWGKGKTKGKGEEEKEKLRERHRIKGTDKTSLKEKEMVEMAMRRGVMANYNVWWSLANTKYAGQAMLIRRELQPTHMWFTLENALEYLSLSTSCSSVSSSKSSSTSSTSTETLSASLSSSSTSSTQTISENTEAAIPAIKSSLSAVPTALSLSTSSISSSSTTSFPPYSPSPSSSSAHDEEGRIIIAKFPSFFLLSVYAPNIGGGVERRQRWDERLELFVSTLQKTSQLLVWMGDFNCAPLDVDISHPSWFKNQRFPFGDKKSSFFSSSFPELNSPTAHLGQPGCTPAERFCFHRIVEGGDLVDVYRLFHPLSLSPTPPPISGYGYTWRGHPGRENPHAAKYYGKGMRIDHFLISRTLEKNIMSVENMGKGAEREGFMGSDHCPVVLKFKAKMHEERKS